MGLVLSGMSTLRERGQDAKSACPLHFIKGENYEQHTRMG